MNNLEKLTEATVEALQGKLTEEASTHINWKDEKWNERITKLNNIISQIEELRAEFKNESKEITGYNYNNLFYNDFTKATSSLNYIINIIKQEQRAEEE